MVRSIGYLVTIACVIGSSGVARAATFTVDSFGDGADANPGDGNCATAGAVCTLRAAIGEANALAGADTIAFSQSGTITLGSALPTITQALTIDGSTATSTPGNPYLAIDGVNGTFIGFDVNHAAATSTIKNLAVMRFTTGIQVSAGSAMILDSWIGTDLSGAVAASNIDGIRLLSSGSTIENCTISGNTGSGIVISGAAATNNVVRGSNIGTDWSGGGANVPNLRGVLIENGATGNTIGGDANLLNRIRTNVNCVVLDGVSGNTISYNIIGACDEDGIVTIVDGPNVYSHNSIAFNGQLGIDLSNDGPTSTGRPVITTARDTGSAHRVHGTINGAPNTQYTIETFGNPACDASTFGEGGTYLAAATVTTNGAGIGDFLVVAPRIDTAVITATATKSGGGTSEFSACMAPAACQVQIPDNSLPTLTAGTFFSQPVITTGGIGAMTYEIVDGTLPTGVTLSNGVFAGVPQQVGTYNITLKATDVDGCTTTIGYQFNVGCGTVNIGPTMLPPLVVGEAYSAVLVGSAGVPPYSFAIASGSLPDGITLAGSMLTGTPTSRAMSSISVSVTDANACTGSQLFMLTTECPLSSLDPTSLPTGNVGELYRGIIQTRGGPEPYTYQLTGELPPGVTFMPNGVLIGTPSDAGSYSFTITSTDSAGCVAMQDYTIDIDAGAGGCCSAGTDAPRAIPLALVVVALSRRRRR